ncbi:transporter [Candidatus Moduliflexus flocculans]|uniref:Transporter n=1 Tax=Candidatus Moduliflexus flocculans TaxID=1499966 RepID=A0A0S6VTX8_9BACT|nr:transporter [Candidatus Moduliflexus flocculans]
MTRLIDCLRSKNCARTVLITGIAVLTVGVFALPLIQALVTSFLSPAQISAIDAPLLPAEPQMFRYAWREYPLYNVPMPSGEQKTLALVKEGRRQSQFLDPQHPDAGAIVWKGGLGNARQLWRHGLDTGNYVAAWFLTNFVLLFRNTLIYALLSTFGVAVSSLIVAYGFARFEFKGRDLLFVGVIITLLLPMHVMILPKYAFFKWIGWIGTWLPLIVPNYFATNALYIFLLRQFLMNIPRELDEAAALDGAGPLRTLFWVVLPQAAPALMTVIMFHVVYCWNDFFEPSLYLAGIPAKFPISTALVQQGFLPGPILQAAGLLASIVPLAIFFAAQRFFIKGVVISGVEK